MRLLEAALRDPERGVTHQLLWILTGLRLLLDGHPLPDHSGSEIIVSQQQNLGPSEEIRQAYVSEMVASLPKRTGKSRSTTAMTILGHLPQNKVVMAAEILEIVRNNLLQEFVNLHPYDQEYLLRQYRGQLKNPSLLPAIERMLRQSRVKPRNKLTHLAAKFSDPPVSFPATPHEVTATSSTSVAGAALTLRVNRL